MNVMFTLGSAVYLLIFWSSYQPVFPSLPSTSLYSIWPSNSPFHLSVWPPAQTCTFPRETPTDLLSLHPSLASSLLPRLPRPPPMAPGCPRRACTHTQPQTHHRGQKNNFHPWLTLGSPAHTRSHFCSHTHTQTQLELNSLSNTLSGFMPKKGLFL